MKKKIDYKIILIVFLILIFIIMLYLYNKSFNSRTQRTTQENSTESVTNKITTQTISSDSEISSALTENIELHATYYFKEIYFKENKEIKEGEKILKYTNGKYLLAPYNCVITKINVPSEKKICTNEHYITVMSNTILKVSLNVDETKINNIKLGDQSTIKIEALDTTCNGYITNISNIASKGKFTVTVEFKSNEDIKIGMTANVEIKYTL